MTELEGKRLLVVGASVSVGQTIALEAARRGARVVAAARRLDLLEKVSADADGDVTPLACDVLEPGACDRVVVDAVDTLGGLDWVVYTPALFMLRELEETTAEEWQRLFALNVTGAALVTAAALPHLSASRGRALYFASVTTDADPHWPGLATYAVSKVALIKMARCWRYERPDVGFTVVHLGGSEGSDGPSQGGWTAEQIERFQRQWLVPGRLGENSKLQERSVVADSVLHALMSPSYIEQIDISPPRA